MSLFIFRKNRNMPIAKQKAEAKGPPSAKVEKPKVEAPKPEPKKVYPPMIGFTMTNLDGLDESGLVPAPKGRLNNLLAQERKVNRFVLPMEWNRPFRGVTNWTSRGHQGTSRFDCLLLTFLMTILIQVMRVAKFPPMLHPIRQPMKWRPSAPPGHPVDRSRHRSKRRPGWQQRITWRWMW